MGPEAELVPLRLARGCRCFAVREGWEVRAYGWLSCGPEWIGEAGIEIKPGPGEGYVWNCVVAPSHRRRGMFAALVRAITEQAQREGLTRLWIGSLEGTAERALGDLGYEPVARLDIEGLGSLQLSRTGGTRRH